MRWPKQRSWDPGPVGWCSRASCCRIRRDVRADLRWTVQPPVSITQLRWFNLFQWDEEMNDTQTVKPKPARPVREQQTQTRPFTAGLKNQQQKDTAPSHQAEEDKQQSPCRTRAGNKTAASCFKQLFLQWQMDEENEPTAVIEAQQQHLSLEANMRTVYRECTQERETELPITHTGRQTPTEHQWTARGHFAQFIQDQIKADSLCCGN